jgi:hypothetical protein
MERSGTGAYFQKEWHLFKLLQFLDDVLNPRKTIGNILQASNVEIQIEENISQNQMFEAGVVSPVSQSTVDKGVSDTDSPKSVEESLIQEVTFTPGTSHSDAETSSTSTKSAPGMKWGMRKKRKLDEQVSDALEKITNRMTLNANPKNEYVASFCNSIHQEMFKMPDDVMEDVKDDVFALLVQARKKKTCQIRSSQ